MYDLSVNSPDFRNLAYAILSGGHRMRFQANGTSMFPFIQDGDILEVVSLAGNRKKINCGDVVLLVTKTERLLAHRVIKINYSDGSASYLIKSDTSVLPDGWFRFEDILGRVEVVERGGRRFVLTSLVKHIKARVWVIVAPSVSKFSWLPTTIRQRLLEWLLVS